MDDFGKTENDNESMASDSADEMDDLDPLKQANLNNIMLGHSKSVFDRPATTDVDKHKRFRMFTDKKK
jgi:hypothetical protein